MEQKKKIVFIVYKAGWWGCFDSLYRELSGDEKNECHVIPVPFYNRSSDGNTIDFGKRHYEAELLPHDIPITNYKNFNLRDIIFRMYFIFIIHMIIKIQLIQ